ncbi:unnamed protein product, partial [Staurois parvus]
GLTTHGAPRAIGDHGAPVSLPTTKKKPIKRYQGHFMGPPTDPGPSGSARVLEWSVRPWFLWILFTLMQFPAIRSLETCKDFVTCSSMHEF